MKARVIATGKILEVQAISDYLNECDQLVVEYKDNNGIIYTSYELDFGLEENIRILDYWTRLAHQYAGMAMQGLMSYVGQITPKEGRSFCDEIVDISFKVAHALVEKYKKEERK